MEGANACLGWRGTNLIVGECKNIFELKRAWFEWFESTKVYLSWEGIHLSSLKVQMHVWVYWGFKGMLEDKNVHLNARSSDLNRSKYNGIS